MSEEWMLFPHSAASNLASSSSAFIAFGHNLCLILFVCYKNKTHGIELSNMPSLMKPLYIVTMFTYFCILSYTAAVILTAVKEIYEAVTCTYAIYAVVSTYSFSKYSLWLFSLTRIHLIFNVDVVKSLGYSTKTLRTIFIILTVCFIQNLSLLLVSTGGKEVFLNENASFCAYDIHYMLAIVYVQLVDQWCTIGCFILFWRKMKALNKLEMSLFDGAESTEFKYVLRKFTILLAANILSSWIATLIVTFTPLGIMAGQIDSILNMWTIVLFDVKFDNIYIAVFGCVATRIPKETTDEVTLSQHTAENGASHSTITMVLHSCTNNESTKAELSESLKNNKPRAPPKLYAFAHSEPIPKHVSKNNFRGRHSCIQSASLDD